MGRYRLNFMGTELHKSIGMLFNKASSDDAKQPGQANIAERRGYLNGSVGESAISARRQFHGGRGVRIYHRELDEFRDNRPETISERRGQVAKVGVRPKVQKTLRAKGLRALAPRGFWRIARVTCKARV
jgi:hypothetical protein